jgi:hypothetical protein
METNQNEQGQSEVLSRSEQIKKVVESWLASGKSQKVFCEENNFKYSTFGFWMTKYKKRNMKKNKTVPSANGFSEVKVKATTSPFVQLNLKDGSSVSIFQIVSADFIRSLIY